MRNELLMYVDGLIFGIQNEVDLKLGILFMWWAFTFRGKVNDIGNGKICLVGRVLSAISD